MSLTGWNPNQIYQNPLTPKIPDKITFRERSFNLKKEVKIFALKGPVSWPEFLSRFQSVNFARARDELIPELRNGILVKTKPVSNNDSDVNVHHIFPKWAYTKLNSSRIIDFYPKRIFGDLITPEYFCGINNYFNIITLTRNQHDYLHRTIYEDGSIFQLQSFNFMQDYCNKNGIRAITKDADTIFRLISISVLNTWKFVDELATQRQDNLSLQNLIFENLSVPRIILHQLANNVNEIYPDLVAAWQAPVNSEVEVFEM